MEGDCRGSVSASVSKAGNHEKRHHAEQRDEHVPADPMQCQHSGAGLRGLHARPCLKDEPDVDSAHEHEREAKRNTCVRVNHLLLLCISLSPGKVFRFHPVDRIGMRFIPGGNEITEARPRNTP